MSVRLTTLCTALALLFTATGCSGAGSADRPQLTVSAAASLNDALTKIGDEFDGAQVRFQFAGSDALATQIRQGARPDVYAAADAELPERLHAEGLVERPVAFATNRLVVVVAADSSIGSLDDLTTPGVTIAVGTPSVPVGSYTRELLRDLPRSLREAINDNIRSSEPDVKGVLGKVASGAVDAGFVYATDRRAAGRELRAIELAATLQPQIVYKVAVVKGTAQTELAREFVQSLAAGSAQAVFSDEGFGPPPE